MSTASSGLGRTATRGVFWLLAQSAGGRLVSILTQLALARLLVPTEFGLISLVYIVTSIAQALVNFGIDGVLLQRHRSLRLWASAAFWVSFGLGLAGFFTVLALAPIIAMVYHAPEVARLAPILALSMPFGALATLPTVKMRQNLDFRFPALYCSVENAVTQLATVVLAATGFGVFSFVIPNPVAMAARACVYWFRAPVSRAVRPRLFQFRFLIGNGLTVFGTRLMSEMVSQGDYAVLGLFASKSVVGLYFFAFRLSAQPVWILASSFNNVLFPALVQLKTNPERQMEAALRAARTLICILLPACFLQAAIMGPALELFFGHRWIGALPYGQLLSLGLPFDGAAWVAGSLLSARRAYRTNLHFWLVMSASFFAAISLGAAFGGGLGVASAVAGYYLLVGPGYSLAVFTRLGARPAQVLSLYARAPMIAAIAIGIPYLASLVPSIRSLSLLRLLIICGPSPFLYLTLLQRFEPDAFEEVWKRLGIRRLTRFLPPTWRKMQIGANTLP